MPTLHGKLIYLDHDSEVLNKNPLGDPANRKLAIYLPPDYELTDYRRYPVVWVLSPFGSWGEKLFNLQAWDENIVQRADRLMNSQSCPPAIMAFPDCFTRLGGSQYLNSSAVGDYEDYLIKELVPLVDKSFQSIPHRDHRALIGHSSGGYGSWMLAMQHPDQFSAFASHSGDALFEYCYLPDFPGGIQLLETVGGIQSFLTKLPDLQNDPLLGHALSLVAMSACYSPDPASPYGFELPCHEHTGELHPRIWERWLALDPVRVAVQQLAALQSLRAIYFDCGMSDEYNLFLGARALDAILTQSNIPHTYAEYDGGHNQMNWRYEISLPFLISAITPDLQ
jgi:enterochelin esterase family protein